MAKAIGRLDMLTDPRYATNAARIERVDEVNDIVQEWFSGHDRDEAVRLLEEADVPAGPVREIDEVVADEQLIARESVVHVDVPGVGILPQPGVVPKFGRTPGRVTTPVPNWVPTPTTSWPACSTIRPNRWRPSLRRRDLGTRMRIVGVDVTAVDVPYRKGVRPVVTSGLVLTGANHLLVRVRTDDGHWGIGEAAPRPSVYGENRDGIAAAIRDYLGPGLIGSDPFAVMSAWQSWSRVVGHNTAKAALDIALHDLAGRAAGVPLYRLLGAGDPSGIPLARALGIGAPDVIAEDAAAAVAAGYCGIKLKVGRDLRTDVLVVDAVRGRVGADVFLYVDANGGYSRLDATRAASRFAAAGVALFEEPLPPGDVGGRLALSRTGGVAILADESINEFPRFISEGLSGSIAAASLRAMRAGFVGARDLVGVSRAISVSLLVGSHRELGVGTAANLHLAAGYDVTLPAELSSSDALEHTLLCEPFDVRHGRMSVPSGPGLGVELDDDAVRHYSTWSFTVG